MEAKTHLLAGHWHVSLVPGKLGRLQQKNRLSPGFWGSMGSKQDPTSKNKVLGM
jgi:hypothetical protein